MIVCLKKIEIKICVLHTYYGIEKKEIGSKFFYSE